MALHAEESLALLNLDQSNEECSSWDNPSFDLCSTFVMLILKVPNLKPFSKGHPPSADLRYGEEDSIKPSTLIVAAIKSKLGIYTLHIHTDIPKLLALRRSKN